MFHVRFWSGEGAPGEKKASMDSGDGECMTTSTYTVLLEDQEVLLAPIYIVLSANEQGPALRYSLLFCKAY